MNNKTKIFGIALIAILGLVALGAGVAFAQTSTTGFGPGWMMGEDYEDGTGYGMMGQRGGMMGGFAQDETGWEWMEGMHQRMSADDGMHTFVWNALGEVLGLTSDELTDAVNSGQTLAEIAEANGVSRDELVTALENSHADALTQAVEGGYLTPEQADSILNQMAGHYEFMIENAGITQGMRGGFSGMMGRAFSWPDSDGQFLPGSCHGNWDNSLTDQP